MRGISWRILFGNRTITYLKFTVQGASGHPDIFRKEEERLGFVEFLAYIRHLGKNALVFFPSKTDLISVADKNGNMTDELLSEQLEKIQNTIDKTDSVLDKVMGTCNIELKDITDADILSAYNIAAITDSNGSTIVETDKIITNADGTYSMEPGTIVYCGDTIDAPEETVGYYRCIKKVTSEYAGDLIFTYTQEAFGTLEYFEYLGNTSIGEEFYTVRGEQAKLNSLESDARAIKNELISPCLSLKLADAPDDIKIAFRYLGELTASDVTVSGSTSACYIIVASAYRNGLVYVSKNFSVSTSVYNSEGATISFPVAAGYYEINGGGMIGTVQTSGITISWKPLGTAPKIQLG